MGALHRYLPFGALGFYLLRQQFVPVPEALELDAENFSKDFTFNIDIDEAIIENRDELNDRGYSDEDIEDLEEEIINNVNKDDILDQIKSDELDSIGGGTMDFDDQYGVYLKRRDEMVDDVEASIDYEVDAGGWNAEYDFKNKAMITVVADEEDEAWEIFARTHNPFNDDWEIVDIKRSEELQSFSAEVFMVDRKIRRRTRWTWTRASKKDLMTKILFHIPIITIKHHTKVGVGVVMMSPSI